MMDGRSIRIEYGLKFLYPESLNGLFIGFFYKLVRLDFDLG